MPHFDIEVKFPLDYNKSLDDLQKIIDNRVKLALAVEILNEFCDKDQRQPYYDIKKHKNGSVYLTIRTQKYSDLPRKTGDGYVYSRREKVSKKFFGKTRFDVTIAAAEYVKEGKF